MTNKQTLRKKYCHIHLRMSHKYFLSDRSVFCLTLSVGFTMHLCTQMLFHTLFTFLVEG